MTDIACHGQQWIHSILLRLAEHHCSIFPNTDRSTENIGIIAREAVGLSPPASTAVRPGRRGRLDLFIPACQSHHCLSNDTIMSDIWALNGGISQRSRLGLNVYSGRCHMLHRCDGNKAGGELNKESFLPVRQAKIIMHLNFFSDDVMILKWPHSGRRGCRRQ